MYKGQVVLHFPIQNNNGRVLYCLPDKKSSFHGPLYKHNYTELQIRGTDSTLKSFSSLPNPMLWVLIRILMSTHNIGFDVKFFLSTGGKTD